MYKTFFLKSLFIATIVFTFASCDNDSNEIGADIVGNDNFEVGDLYDAGVNAFSQKTDAVETSDLLVNALGIYNDPVFGVTKGHVAVQVQLNPLSVNPTIDAALNPVIDSVILKIPYFIRKKTTGTGGASTYTLDSIYSSSTTAKIKLRIYESKYYIRDLDVNQELQKYYSNQNADFNNGAVLGPWLNNSSDVSQNDAFSFSNKEFTEIIRKRITGEDSIVKRIPPGIRFKLDTNFFKTKIIEAPEGKLLNNNIFEEYFRGLYFNVDYAGADTTMGMLNIKGGTITIYYKEDEITTTTVNGVTTTITTRESKTLPLNLSGKSIGLLENIPTPTTDNTRLYVKGGEGSMGVIDLFNPGELEELRSKKWLVNDASLTFTIDQAAMANTVHEPNRIYLYDLTNKRPLIDYYTDINSPSSNPKYTKSVFGGLINTENDRGTIYKIRITNYIRGLLKNADSTNVRLGLVVTETISDVSNKKLKTAISNPEIKEIPRATVMSPLGTVLFGSSIPVGTSDYDKKIKFKIYFTKPKQN